MGSEAGDYYNQTAKMFILEKLKFDSQDVLINIIDKISLYLQKNLN